MTRVHLAGTRAFGAATLDAILGAGHTVTGVTSPAYRNPGVPAWAGDDTDPPDPLHAAALRRGIPWTDTIGPGTVEGADVIVSAHSHAFIGRRTRAAVRYALGYHPSLLPVHRGRDAVRWTIRDRDRIAGGTVYHLTDTVDGGPIAAQDWCYVRPDDTAGSLWRRDLFPMGVRLIVRALRGIDEGRVPWVPQDESLATWEPAMSGRPLHRPELPELPGRGAWGVTADPTAARV